MNNKSKSGSPWNSGAFKSAGGGIALLCLAFLSLCCLPLRAQVPAGALVELGFSDGLGSATATNTGVLGGWAGLLPCNSINDPQDTAGNEDPGGYPLIATNHPAGTYAPANLFSLNNGTVTGASGDGNGTGGWQTTTTNTPYFGGPDIDTSIETSGGLAGTLVAGGPQGPAWPGFSLTLWVNAVDLSANGKQNEIVYALDGQSGGPQNGFNLVHAAGGNLQCSVNESAGDAPTSVGALTADPNAGTANWIFVAITYDPTLALLGSNSLCYYFGNANQLAYLDSTFPYVAGVLAGQGLPPYITNTGCLTLGNYGDVDVDYEGLFGGNSSRIFKGFIAEVKVYSNVLDINGIQQAQVNNTVAPTSPSFLAGGQPGNQTIPSGLTATFNAIASGSGTLNYQWKTNNVNVTGATNAIFQIANTQLAMNGLHVSVGVTNSVSPGILSSNATLTVVPSNPLLVSMSFDEGYTEAARYTTNLPNNTLTTNSGALGGYGVVNVHTAGSGSGSFPYFSSYVPVGTFAPNSAANLSSLYVGNYYDNTPDACASPLYSGQGERWIDFPTNALSPSGQLPAMTGLTICGWANSDDVCFRGSGNTEDVIVDALNSAGTVGFRLVHDSSWALELEVNSGPHPATDPESSFSVGGTGGLTVDDSFGPNNWVFFAVTYDGTLSANNVNYYFGSPTTAAALDSTSPLTYNQGTLSAAGPLTIASVNVNGSGRTITGQNSPCFRGYLDEIKIYSSVLTLAQLQAVQTGTEVPIILFANDQGANVKLSWGATTTEQLQSKTNLATGSWNNVTNIPTVLSNIYTVTLPITNHQTFFRLAP